MLTPAMREPKGRRHKNNYLLIQWLVPFISFTSLTELITANLINCMEWVGVAFLWLAADVDLVPPHW